MTPLQIGSVLIDPPVLMAPMAGFTDYAYRQIVRGLGGCGLPITEMVSARSVRELGRRGAPPPDRLWGIQEEPRPLAVQIWDNHPETLAEVGRRLAHELGATTVDLNFGCPVKEISVKAESGSYLLSYPDRVGAIVERVAAACRPTPVTAKIRLGPSRDAITAIDVAQAVEGAGGAALTIHGRTAADMYRGTADWEQIAAVKPHLKRIPLIGNGDLRTPQAAADAMARYGVDGVMLGRGAVGRPWLFRQAAAAIRGEPIPAEPSVDQQRAILLEHYRLVAAQHGPHKGTILMRKFASRYGHGFPFARHFRGRVAVVSTPEEFFAAVDEFFRCEA